MLNLPTEQDFTAEIRTRAAAIDLPIGHLLERADLARNYIRDIERKGHSPTLRVARRLVAALEAAETRHAAIKALEAAA